MGRRLCSSSRRRCPGSESLGLEGLLAYRRYLELHPAEWRVLDECCRITISRFYRDRPVWDYVRHALLPQLAAEALEWDQGLLRAWSAGCASGEEPYTLALAWQLEWAANFPRAGLEAARNEGEVAGVLAHEIAHVALRHGTHNVSKAYVTQAGLGLFGQLLGRKSSAGTSEIVNKVGGFGLNVLFLKHSRGAESEADVLGSQIMARAGYDPRDMASFFQTIERTSQSNRAKTINWLSSHPSPARRTERIQQEARSLNVASTRSRPSASLASVQSVLRGMPKARVG